MGRTYHVLATAVKSTYLTVCGGESKMLPKGSGVPGFSAPTHPLVKLVRNLIRKPVDYRVVVVDAYLLNFFFRNPIL